MSVRPAESGTKPEFESVGVDGYGPVGVAAGTSKKDNFTERTSIHSEYCSAVLAEEIVKVRSR